ncbi:Homocysteine S-methyltransferase 1 [Podila minutissima]|uniref:Homocysteine S-methyltransferase 1 n=1 Tax=Podila minutissima TaxID=64525 RepID=A0A9P5SGK1_9FUNG|nr:Homocysteine S-methyltransferase 1 [Podila minutissima]
MDLVVSVPHDHHAAELLIPFGLLSFTILAGLYRYFFVLRVRSYYAPLIAQEDSQEHSSRRSKLSTLGRTIVGINKLIALTFIADLVVIILRSMIDHVWSGTLIVVYNVASFVAFSANLGLMFIEVGKGGQWSWANYTFWWLALAGESFIGWYHLNNPVTPTSSPEEDNAEKYRLAFMGVFAARYALLVLLTLLSFVYLNRESKDDDLEALRAFDAGAPNEAGPSTNPAYGTFGSSSKAKPSVSSSEPTMSSSSDAEMQKKLSNEEEERANAFKDWRKKVRKLIPLVYPKDSTYLKFLIFITFILLILGRVVNYYVPKQTGHIVDILDKERRFDVGAILLYVLLRFLQGGSGLVNVVRGWAWIPIEQYSNSTLTIQFFQHVHNLSLQFHLNRKTGELLRILDRGTSSIVSLLSTILFQLLPVVVDVAVAVVYFYRDWSWEYAVIVFVTILLYIIVTVTVTEWRTRFRRAMISFDNDARAKAVDSLLNFETVKYYSNEQFEVDRYREAIRKYMVADYKSQVTYQLLNLMQTFVITLGLLVGCLLCAYEISQGKRRVAHFVIFLTYLVQLYQPLNWFGTYYRMLQQNFIDMEKMIQLLEQNQSVHDSPEADRLIVTDGEVVFENVNFQYDTRQKGLHNISFTAPKGKTVALVGPTGSGKSTILRLLFRFYDVSSGRILVDGQDISKKTQTSLREQIGVVPQDSVLFNDSIFYNINYGRTSASKEEVEEAAKAAQIHDKIQEFPDGYETKVGERGLRLSGGEKQRVAIARTILKNPPIVLLDEATSALDSTTESQIQAALAQMTMNRTTLVVAHRLSTIVNADLILCIKDGVIVEQGSHDELIARAIANNGEGVYYEMWKQQIREERGDDATTIDGSESEGSDSKGKGKGRKYLRGPQQMAEIETAAKPFVVTGAVITSAPPVDSSDLTEVVVDRSMSSAVDTMARAESSDSLLAKDSEESEDKSGGEGAVPTPTRPTSKPASPKTPLTANERAKLRKKKSNKKK